MSVSGHSGAVVDCSWDADGRYVLSASSDQSSRVFAPVHSLRSPSRTAPWCEIARPQVHGFDLCAACLLPGPIAHRMCSGADEKVIRVFLATHSFIQTLHNVSDPTAALQPTQPLSTTQPSSASSAPSSSSSSSSSSSTSSSSSSLSSAHSLSVTRSIRAVLPELGLSNRGLQAGDAVQQLKGFTPHTATVEGAAAVSDAASPVSLHADEDDDDDRAGAASSLAGSALPDNGLPPVASSASHAAVSSSASSSVFSLPPTDSQLAMLTLWPEVDKLYGHGNEIRRLCASPDGLLLASSCAAKTASQADVLLFDTGSWMCVGRVHSHSNTVSCIAFSHDSSMLLTGSKDRHITLTRITHTAADNGTRSLQLDSVRLSGHTRIVWDCSWSPDDVTFATCSRDKSIKLWTHHAAPLSASPTSTLIPAFSTAVTALAFVPSYQFTSPGSSGRRRYHLAAGTDEGEITVWTVDTEQQDGVHWQLTSAACVMRIDTAILPTGTIHRLSFRPHIRPTSSVETIGTLKNMMLAASCADHTLRLYECTI